jgi:hypothetical protein
MIVIVFRAGYASLKQAQTNPKRKNLMTHSYGPCNETCPTPQSCSVSGDCHFVDLDSTERLYVPDEFNCPENYSCPTQAICTTSKLCHEQMQFSSQTTWYRHIVYLRRIVGDHYIWMLSGNIGDHCIVDQWMNHKITPTMTEKRRLHEAQQWVEYVVDLCGEEIARAWFVGGNVEGMYVHEAISQDRFDLVEASANEQPYIWAT